MVENEKEHGRIVETPIEARQAEPGPSILALLVVSISLAVLILGVVWSVFLGFEITRCAAKRAGSTDMVVGEAAARVVHWPHSVDEPTR